MYWICFLCLSLHTMHACSVRVCLHNGSWCFCSGGLRSWEKHEAVTRRRVPTMWLLQPDFSTVVIQPSHFPAASSIKVRGTQPLWAPWGIPGGPYLTLALRDGVGTQKEIPLTSSATVLNILPLFSKPPHPSSHFAAPPPLPPPLLTQPLLAVFAHCSCIHASFFFLFFLPRQ